MTVDDVRELINTAFSHPYPSQSVVIANWESDSFSLDQMECFLRLMGAMGEPLIAGWFEGSNGATDYTEIFAVEPFGRVTIWPTSDWDWIMWQVPAAALLEAISKKDEGPTVLLPVSGMWLLESPLSVRQSYLTMLPAGVAPAIASSWNSPARRARNS